MTKVSSEQTFPGKYNQLRLICEFVNAFAEEAGFSENDLYQISLAVDEACSNIIEHAYGAEDRGNIECSCSFVSSVLTITLRDDGQPFSPDDVPKPNIHAPLKQRKGHGLGYFFIQKIMDDVIYSPNDGNGNLLVLRKKLGVDLETIDLSTLEWDFYLHFGEDVLNHSSTGDGCKFIMDTIESKLQIPCKIWLSPDLYPLPGEDDSLLIFDKQAPKFIKQAFNRFNPEKPKAEYVLKIKSDIAIALRTQETLLGIIHLQVAQSTRLKKPVKQFLQQIAANSALGLQINRQIILKNWRYQQLTLVRTVSAQISSIQNLDQLSSQITRLIQQTFNYYHVAIFTQEEKDDFLRFRSSFPENQRLFAEPIIAKSIHKGMIGYVGKTAKHLLASDVTKEKRYHFFDDLADTCSELVLPLVIEDRLLGVLDIQSTKKNDFHEIDLIALNALADQIALAIEGSLQYKEIKRNADQMNVVFEVSQALNSILDYDQLLDEIIKLIHERFHFPYVQIYIKSISNQKLIYQKGNIPFKSPDLRNNLTYDLDDQAGIIPWVAREGKIKLVNNISEEPLYIDRGIDYLGTVSELAIPLVFGEEVLGVLDIQSDKADAFSTKHDLEFLQTLAASISVAMRNSRLFRSEQWRRMVADTFQDVATLLPKANDPQVVLEEILKHIETILPTSASAIWLLDQNDQNQLQLAAAQCVDPNQVVLIHQESESVRDWMHHSIHTQQTTIRKPDDPFGPLGEALSLPDDYSSIATPLYANQKPLGLLTIVHNEPGRYGNEARAITSTFASYASIAIQNAMHYAEAQTNAWIATILLQVAEACQNAENIDDLLEMLVRITPMLVGVNKAAAFLYDKHLQGMIYKAGYGLPAAPYDQLITIAEAPIFYDLIDQQMIININDSNRAFSWLTDSLCKENETAYLIPLSTRQELHGALLLTQSKEQPKSQMENDQILRISQGIARHTATALDNLIHVESRQQESYVTAVLLQVAQTISSNYDLLEILTNITYLVNLLAGINQCQIFTWDQEEMCFFPILEKIPDSDPEHQQFLLRSYPNGSLQIFSQAMISEEPFWLEVSDPANLFVSLHSEHGFPVSEIHQHKTTFNKTLLIAVPLIVKGELYGMLTAFDAGQAPQYREKRLEIITGVSQQIAIAMQNEKLQLEMIRREHIEQEFKLAKKIQQTFLPDHFPEMKDWMIEAIWKPALDIGGDFYDVFQIDEDHIGLVIADVSDKGMGAALYMTVTRTLIRANAHNTLSPGTVLNKVNQQLLLDTQNGMFVTAAYIILNIKTGEFIYANAGHNFPLLYQPAKAKVEKLPKGNLALGVMEDIQYEDHQFSAEIGDALFMYTDGITENFSPSGEDFGEDRFTKLIKKYSAGTLTDFINTITDELTAFHGDLPPSDDITLLAIQHQINWRETKK
ncbi:MAG: GAF domain-containing protein [Anaerolineaceae bacterium]|nr:GAF domain-containing protein [Anaerolineaceae bacterium]